MFLLALVACQPPEILPEPDILVSNSSLEINAVKRVFELTVRNTGEEASLLEWDTERTSLALVVEPANGSLAKGESQVVKVSVNRANVPIADRIEERVVFESNGGDKTVFVTFSIEGTGLAACGTYPTSIRPPEETPDDDGPGLDPPDSPTPPSGGSGLYAPDELLVGYKHPGGELQTAGINPARRAQTLAAVVSKDYGLVTKKQPGATKPALVKIPAGQDPLVLC